MKKLTKKTSKKTVGSLSSTWFISFENRFKIAPEIIITNKIKFISDFSISKSFKTYFQGHSLIANEFYRQHILNKTCTDFTQIDYIWGSLGFIKVKSVS